MSQARSLNELLHFRALQQPEDLAFRCVRDDLDDAESLTYAALDRRARGLAAHLARDRVQGECVAIILPTGGDFLTAFFGALYAGAAVAPLASATSPRTVPRLRALLADLRPRVVLTSRVLLDGMAAAFASEAEGGPRILAVEDLVLEDEIAAPVSVAPHDVAVLQYTSGSTSTPKGVEVTHDNLLRQGELIRAITAWDGPDSIVSWLPLYHDMGLVGGVILPLCRGAPGTLIAPSSFTRRPAVWLEAISRFKGTLSPAPNFAYELCCERIDEAARATLDLRSWRAAFCGAEPIRARTLSRFQAMFAPCGLSPESLLPCYGLAEATLLVSGCATDSVFTVAEFDKADLEQSGRARLAGGSPATALVSCGRPHGEQILVIVDPATEQALGDGLVGEIWISGRHVAAGYKDRPDATRETFGASLPGYEGRSFLRTGDLGFLHDGELYIAGRLKDLIIVRGANHYPQDLEATATASHPALSTLAAAAFSVEDEEAARVVLFQEIPRGWTGVGAPIADAIRQQVAIEHGVHLDLVVLGRQGLVPRTSSGKVQRRAARDRLLSDDLDAYRAQSFAAPSPAAPRVGARPGGPPQARVRALWAEVLGHANFSITDSFFEVGGDSLRLAALHGALQDLAGFDFPLVELFDHPTVREMAELVGRHAIPAPAPPIAGRSATTASHEDAIAIVGMACRLPGARDVEDFWRALIDGDRAIEATSAGGAPGSDPDWVGVRASLAGATCFDFDYFGYSAAEAAWIDPQQRVLLENAVEALEDAGCDPARFPGPIGVFAGCGLNLSRMARLLAQRGRPRDAESWLALLGADKDYLASRLAYKLDLRGPAITVQSACSSALSAVHQAILSLRAGDCDLALAGGVSIADDGAARGYRFVAGDVMSQTGVVRPFDAQADGTVFGDGAGLVVLKRLADAQRDRDMIRGVIRGSAINNDGGAKLGFTAPSARGQREVIGKALAAAGVSADSVGYIETHGTGTALGDPIEVAALGQALGKAGGSKRTLGALKGSIGHLNAAAGVAGLIKATLAVERGVIPPHPTFSQFNPLIDPSAGDFTVNTAPLAWAGSDTPRRAGVSAFGFGGTNVHLVVEQPPEPAPVASLRDQHVLLLSARSPGALDAMSRRLADHLRAHTTLDIADVAHTLMTGRARHEYGRAVVCEDLDEAVLGLKLRDRSHVLDARRPGRATPPVCLLFPGQGSQQPGMGKGLYAGEPLFKETIDTCAAILADALPGDMRDLLFAEGAAAGEALAQTAVSQPALFAFEYALARLWIDRGVRPSAMLGHSLGEFVAACLAGVFSLEDALRAVALRGRLMQAQPSGAMAAIGLPPEALAGRLVEPLALAAVNGARQCVVSGPKDALTVLVRDLKRQGAAAAFLRTSHAFHSPMMAAARAPFVDYLRTLRLGAPSTPFLSNLTGDWITDAEATDPEYWGAHMLGSVRFDAGLSRLEADLPGSVLLEVGSGQILSALARSRPAFGAGGVIASLPAGKPVGDEGRELAGASARLLLAGVELDPERLYPEGRHRTSLPTYPFESVDLAAAEPDAQSAPITAACPVTTAAWTRAPRADIQTAGPARSAKVALVGADGPLRRALAKAYDEAGASVRLTGSEPLPPGSALEPSEDLVILVGDQLGSDERARPWALAAALGEGRRLIVVSVGCHDVIGDEARDWQVAQSHVLARTMTASQPGRRFRGYDLGADEADTKPEVLARQIVEDDWSDPSIDLVAFRRGARWTLRAALAARCDEAATPRANRWLVVGESDDVIQTAARALEGDGRRVVVLARSAAAPDATWTVTQQASRAAREASVVIGDSLTLAAAIERARSCLGSVEGLLQVAPSSPAPTDEAPAGDPPGLDLALALQPLLVADRPALHVLLSSDPAHGYYEALAASGRLEASERTVAIAWDLSGASTPDPCLLPAFLASGATNLRVGQPRRAAAPRPERAPPTARRALSTPFVAPRSATEILVAEIIGQTLKVDEVGLEDDFFEMGGHSLLGMQVATRLRDRLGVSLELRALFDDPTVRGIVAQISSAEWEEIEI